MGLGVPIGIPRGDVDQVFRLDVVVRRGGHGDRAAGRHGREDRSLRREHVDGREPRIEAHDQLLLLPVRILVIDLDRRVVRIGKEGFANEIIGLRLEERNAGNLQNLEHRHFLRGFGIRFVRMVERIPDLEGKGDVHLGIFAHVDAQLLRSVIDVLRKLRFVGFDQEVRIGREGLTGMIGARLHVFRPFVGNLEPDWGAIDRVSLVVVSGLEAV